MKINGMKLNVWKLENAIDQDDGSIIARCPVCAKTGNDQKGNHLKIFPNGNLACAAYQGEAGVEHRREAQLILGLVPKKRGRKSTGEPAAGPPPFRLNQPERRPPKTLGRFGRLLSDP